MSAVEGFGAVFVDSVIFGLVGLQFRQLKRFTINPDINIGLGAGREQIGKDLGILIGQHIGGLVFVGSGGCHDVAFDITTGGQGRAELPHNATDNGLEIGLQNTVHLKGLAGGNAEGAIAIAISQIIEGEIQRWGHIASGLFGAQHNAIVAL